MKKLLILGMIVLCLGTIIQAQESRDFAGDYNRPNGFPVGAYTYSTSTMWDGGADGDSALQFWGPRLSYCMGIGDGTKAQRDSIELWNDNVRFACYVLYQLPISDTTHFKAWCNANGYDWTDYVLIADGSTTFEIRQNPVESHFNWYRVTGPDSVIETPGFVEGAENRFWWDVRGDEAGTGGEPIGEYLSYVWDSLLADYGNVDDKFVDEEFIQQATAGIYMIQFPMKDVTTDYILQGDWTGLSHPWSGALSHAEIRDSVHVLREPWMSYIRDNGTGYYLPNFASIPGSNLGYWTGTGQECAENAGGYAGGEYGNMYPSLNGYEQACNNMAYANYQMRNTGAMMHWGWIMIGHRYMDSTINYYLERTQRNGLGTALNGWFAGTYKPYFEFAVTNGQTDLIDTWSSLGAAAYRTYNMQGGGTAYFPDDVSMWWESLGHYWGYPTSERDTATTGTDPQGQSYTLHKFATVSAAGETDTLVYIVGRFTRGADRTSATAVSVTLPGGTWYEANVDGSFSEISTDPDILNGDWHFYTTDTLTMLNGPSGSESSTPGTPKMQNITIGGSVKITKIEEEDHEIISYWDVVRFDAVLRPNFGRNL